jgi:hypothetical protein
VVGDAVPVATKDGRVSGIKTGWGLFKTKQANILWQGGVNPSCNIWVSSDPL